MENLRASESVCAETIVDSFHCTARRVYRDASSGCHVRSARLSFSKRRKKGTRSLVILSILREGTNYFHCVGKSEVKRLVTLVR